ncbi:AI-2E family transporter [Limibaculum sp. FT325]|uniref:AI-2E family transporter n=1 Tax=Thermohalobaculum sediminis TaxID=2939436 RepID=UPI0020BD545C|nr:AI-2E family transporter [Limibaculum sediminis]MCL5776101.1 AI-2E family transporter [Limibaculum sediminis]
MQDEIGRHRRVVRDAVDIYVTLGLITLFVWLSAKVVAPFVSILVWSMILAVALYPAFVWIKDRMGGRSGLAATALAVLGLVLLIGPTVVIADSIIGSTIELAERLRGETLDVPPPDPSVRDWPIVGNMVFGFWSSAHADLSSTAEHFAPQIREFATFLLGVGAGLARGVLEFAVSVVLAAVALGYAGGLGDISGRMAERVASGRGRMFLDTAKATIRNVSRGVIGVAIIQGGLAAGGMIAIGLPFAGLVAAIAIAAAVVQLPALAILPTIIYVWTAEPTLPAALYTAYMVPVMLSDNFLKPILMARGLATPMIVILIGVIGGTLSSGLTGLFIGPVILAVFYEMFRVWIADVAVPRDAAAGTAGDPAGGSPSAG